MIAQESIEDLVARIAEEFDPERIVLFGSHAYGRPEDGSDVDLLVVLPFEGKSFYKSMEVLDRLKPKLPIDLIVRRPEDVERRYALGDPLIREALDRGRVLYERCGPGMG